MTLILSGTDGVSDIDGTAATPAIRGTDANTGIFFPAADTIAFAEGGAEAMRIDSDGDVGIGTTTPSQKLHVQSTSNAQGLFKTTGAGGGSNRSSVILEGPSNTWYINTNGSDLNGADASLGFYGNSATRMVIDSSGNVGIGTSSPVTKFHVYESATNLSVYGRIENNRTRNAAVLTKTTNGGFYTGTSIGTDTLCWQVYDDVAGERARITSGGYFKASNSGTYNGSTDSYHELRQTANDATLVQTSTNASLASVIQANKATRSATSSYIFLRCESNAGSDIEFDLKGDGNAYADGTWNNNGADYAEFFESANGQALTLGATVVLDGNKVREATSQDPASAIIGVVRPKEPSKASMVVGNTAWNKWANKYLTDDFDRYIMEDHDVVEWEETITDEEGMTSTKQHSYESHNIPAGVTVPADAVRKTHDDKGNKFQHYKLNPAWDKDAEYVNRENRPEWNIIGLLGQVKILKGQPVGDRWIKMRDVSATVEEWMIR